MEQKLRERGKQAMAGATAAFLKRHPPFENIPEALRFVAERARLAYFAEGSVILGPDSGPDLPLHILETGKVRAEDTDDPARLLGPGACFPIGALIARRAPTQVFTALEDSFCYQLPAEDFAALTRISPEFQRFCTECLADLLFQARQRLQWQSAQRAGEQQSLNSPLAAVISARPPVAVSPETPLRAALETLSREKIGSLPIVDGQNKPLGIFTRSDILDRVVLADLPLDTPVSGIMSTPPLALREHATVYDAMFAMADRGLRHILVTNAEGCLTGVLSERDLFALQRIGLRQIRQAIESAPDIAALQQSAADIRQLALNMLAQGIAPERLTQFISVLNDALTRRVLQQNLMKHNLEGIDWCWLAFGSEGRDEQTFSTDQDNGIIFLSGGQDQESLRPRLLDFAKAANEDLDHCGFPLCKGNIMASNPQWCLSLEEWEARFNDWIRTPQPEALLNASIFFDFRPLFGQMELAGKLRHHLLALTTSSPLFLRAMARNALDVEPPLGTFRDFLTGLEPEHPGKIDLKKYGSRIFVDAARIHALAAGVANTHTAERLRLASERLKSGAEDIPAAIDAFDFIQLLRLRQQRQTGGPDRQSDNLIDPDTLNALDRRILKESFRQARKIQARLKLDYQVN